jgi:hypothetical protein
MLTLLADEYRDDPIQFVRVYCSDDYLTDLSGLFKIYSLANEHKQTSIMGRHERSFLFYRFQMLLKLLEANSLLYKMLEEKEITYTIKKPIYHETKR